MRLIKIYLIIVTALLIIGIGFGVYVWYMIQRLDTQIGSVEQVPIAPQETESSSTSTVPSTTQEPIIMQTKDLTEAQRAILKGFGYTQDSFTITPAMITCAEEAVGKTRMEEIMKGSAPTPLESIRLLPCFK